MFHMSLFNIFSITIAFPIYNSTNITNSTNSTNNSIIYHKCLNNFTTSTFNYGCCKNTDIICLDYTCSNCNLKHNIGYNISKNYYYIYTDMDTDTDIEKYSKNLESIFRKINKFFDSINSIFTKKYIRGFGNTENKEYNCYKYNSTFCMITECLNFPVKIKNKNNIKILKRVERVERVDMYIDEVVEE